VIVSWCSISLLAAIEDHRTACAAGTMRINWVQCNMLLLVPDAAIIDL
jgi:hypothetical protein